MNTPTDTEVLDWLLPVVTGVDAEYADVRTQAIARALIRGLDGREALHEAMKEETACKT